MRIALAFVVASLLSVGSLSHANCPVPSQLSTDLAAAGQSDVIDLAGVSPLACPEVGMTETWTGGRLVFSDSPESPTSTGKLYDDPGLAATSGTIYNRIFVYHVNNTGGTKRIVVVIKNTGTSSATLTVQKSSLAGPTTSFLYAGKLGFQRWLDSTANSPVTVPAGSWVQLDATFNGTNVSNGNLLHGIWDYSFSQPHEVAICILKTRDAPTSKCPTASLLSRDTHTRGTFPYADKVYDTSSGVTIDTSGDIQQFPLAGNTTNDTAAVGTDVTDGSSQTLAGNFGVLYRMHLATVSSDGRKVGFLLNPRGGQWGGAVWAMPGGELPGGKFLIPAGSGSTGLNTKGAVEGRYNPGAGLTPWMQFMPTGGSSFPLRVMAVPY